MSEQIVRIEPNPIPEATRQELAKKFASLDVLRNSEPPAANTVLANRRQAQTILDNHQEIDPTKPVSVDLEGFEIVAASFVHELMRGWPLLTPINVSEEVNDSFELARSYKEEQQS